MSIIVILYENHFIFNIKQTLINISLYQYINISILSYSYIYSKPTRQITFFARMELVPKFFHLYIYKHTMCYLQINMIATFSADLFIAAYKRLEKRTFSIETVYSNTFKKDISSDGKIKRYTRLLCH